MKPFILTLITWIAVILGATGLGVFAWGLVRLLIAARTRQWPTAPGTIVSSRVTQREAPASTGERDVGSDRRPMPPQTLYRAEVSYRYAVDSRPYTGSSILLDDIETSSEGYARGLVERYPPGARVDVYHHPSNPERAVLEPGIHKASWLIPGAGLILAIVASALGTFVRWWFLRR